MNQKVDVKIGEDSFMETFNRVKEYDVWSYDGNKIEIVEFAPVNNHENEDGSIYKCLQKDSVSYYVEVKGRKIRIYISPKMRAKIMFEDIGENVKND